MEASNKKRRHNMFILAQKFICTVCAFFMMLYGSILGVNFCDTEIGYREKVSKIEFFDNTIETAVPQTEIFNVISDHFDSELPEGKTVKKCIVIGYDGCRIDSFSVIDEENSAVAALVNGGGTAAVAYCGAHNYPMINTQMTSTAPGWCSMLTGKWASETGIRDNDIVKSNDYLTLLTTLVEDGKAGSSAFYVSWNGHFVADDSTYHDELAYINENGISSKWLDADDDNGTLENIMNDVKSADCSDFIFSIFEYCDHFGHDTGFGPNNPEYAKAFNDNDRDALDIINAIKARDSYDTEDWLIVLASDHGGYNTGHGAMTLQERMMFFVTSKPVDYDYSYTCAGLLGKAIPVK